MAKLLPSGRSYTAILLAALLCGTARAQLTVSPQTDLQALARTITGPGVSISNPSITCHAEGYGEFAYSGSVLGPTEGILLTSGRITETIGPNNVENKSFQQGTAGNALLNVVTGRTTRDACLFEFDIIPSGDSLRFNFVLGSEEYNEWVGSQYNDVFGFFISGPGIAGDPGIGNDHNIALIPGTNLPVTINNVNNGSNSAYYFDNVGGQHIQYDGLTRGLYAESIVQPCATYHLKLVVADATDRKFDSGVFIERIRSNPVQMTSHTVNGTPHMVEGCNPGSVTFTRQTALPTPLTLQYFLQGTSTNGTDYTAIGDVDPNAPKFVTIPAGQHSATVAIDPIADAITEPMETLHFILGNPFCPALDADTLIFNLNDTIIATVSPLTSTICRGDSVQFNIVGGASYSWTPPSGLSSITSGSPWAKPLTTTNYQVTINEGICSRTVTRQVRVSDPILTATTTRPLCNGQSNGAINLSHSGGIAPYTFNWTGPNGFTASTEDLVNVPAGTYTVTLTDGAGCQRTQSFNLGSPAVLGGTLSPSILPFGENVACFGGATGSLGLSLVGGTGPYSTNWTGPNGFTSTSLNLTGLRAGAYQVNVIDANGCTFSSSYTMTQPSAIGPTVTGITDLSCFGTNVGTATVNVAGGTPPFTYTWNSAPAQSNATATGLAAGSYIATVTDGYGCSSTATATIGGPTQALSTTLSSSTQVACFGASTGAATVAASGGTGPYTYSWNTTPTQNAAAASGLAAGTWTCTVTDAHGCTAARNVSITQPATTLSSALGTLTHVLCSGTNTGSATVSATGGTAPYTYSWNSTPIQTGATASNLPAGTWTCTITDAGSCSTTTAATITQPSSPLATTIASQVNVSCHASNTGSVTLSVTGGTAPYTYNWNTVPAQNSATATALAAGTWTCTVTDAHGCSTNRSVTITQPGAPLSGTVAAQTNVACAGANTGSATVSASGGTAPYTYTWNSTPIQNTATATSLTAGTWVCSITDANGCAASRTVTITQPAGPVATAVTGQNNVSCFGAGNGSATVSATGGTAPYTFSWNTSPVQASATANNLSAGTWICTVTDANGCSSARNVSITQPSAALATAISAQTNVACFGSSTGSATVSASGGTGPYTFSWNSTPAQSTATATGLPAGSWTCTVSDAQGCTATRTISISQPVAALSASVTAQTNVGCHGANTGSATVSVVGGTAPYTYTWNTIPGQTGASASNLPAGSWTCTVADANGCSTTRTISITQPASVLAASVGSLVHVTCFGASTGSATLSATGGTSPYTYSWNTAPVQTGATASNLPAGTWTCSITDANGCITTRNATITQPIAALTSSISAQTNVTCAGANTGSATLSVTGGTTPYTFSWNTVPAQSGATASGLLAGTWTCTVVDANGCTTDRSVTITQPTSALGAMISAQSNVTCFGSNTGSATVSPSGGTPPYVYSWNTSPAQVGATASDLAAGTWTCLVTDGNGCSNTRSVVITQPASTLAIAGSVTAATCGGAADGAIDASVTGGTSPYSTNWTGPNGYTDPNTDLANVPAGVYTLTVVDAQGCQAVRNFDVGQPGLFSISSTLSDHNGYAISCATATDGAITLTVSGGTAPYTHAWIGPGAFSANTQDLVGLAPGSYTYVITDDNGCSSSLDLALSAPPALGATLTSPAHSGGWNVSCQGASDGSIDLTIQGGVAPIGVQWNGPNAFQASTSSIGSLSAGTYALVLTDANGCQFNSSATLTEPGALVANGAAIENVACFGDATGIGQLSVVGGTAPYIYVWNTTPVQNTANVVDLPAGTWTCTVTDANACSTTGSISILQPAAPLTVTFPAINDVLCFGSSGGSATAMAAGGTAPYGYVWDTAPAQSTAVASGLAAGDHLVTVTDVRGCQATNTVSIAQPATEISAFFDQVTHVSCFGANDGEATISISGGSGAYSIAWDTTPIITGNTASGLAPGLYMVAVSDANGCAQPKFFPVTIQGASAPLAFDIVATPISCYGAFDGSIDLTVSGGQGPYSHIWTDGGGQSSGLEDLVDLDQNTFALHLSDMFGCSLDTVVTITEPAELQIAGSITTAACQGAADGAVDVTISGGTLGHIVAWAGPDAFTAITEDISDLAAGTYVITVNDANGCQRTEAFQVAQPGSLEITATPFDHVGGWGVSCLGNSDGGIDLSITGGAAPYVVQWSGPAAFSSTDEDIQSLEAGNYSASVTDLNGCMASVQVTITTPDALTATISTSSFNGHQVSCAGAEDGSATILAIGGTAPYSVQWTGPNGSQASTEEITGIGAGTYDVSITDANGCTTVGTTTIVAPTPMDLSLSTTSVNTFAVPCAGGTNGAIDLSISGGVAPYAIAWNDGVGPTIDTEDLSGLGAGDYQVSVVDANGCAATASIQLEAPEPIDISAALSAINGSHVSCQGALDGSIDLTVSGGTAPFNFAWSNGAATEDLDAITSGTYDVVVTDANGCAATSSFTLLAPTSILVDLSGAIGPSGAHILCAGGNDGALDALVSGGTAPYTMAWEGPNGYTSNTASISGLYAGNYAFNVTDANGCTRSTSMVLTEPAPLQVGLSTVTYNGGFNIPCSTISIGVFNSAVTGGTPGYAYTWTGPNGFTSSDADPTSLQAGTYDLIVSDANGCTGTASASLTAPSPLDVTLSFSDFNGSPISCAGNDGAIALSVVGGAPAYEFDWTGPDGFGSQQADIADLTPGTYTLSVHDANGCSRDTVITLEAAEPLSAMFNTTANVCAGAEQGSIDLTVSGGGSPHAISWTGPDGFASNNEDLSDLASGTYTVHIADGLGCDNSFSTTIGGPAPVASGAYSSFYGQYNLQCQGDSSGVIALGPTGGAAPYTVSLNCPNGYTSSELQHTDLVAGAYAIHITDNNGCVLDTTVTLTEPGTSVVANLTLSVYPSGTNVSCYGASDGWIDASISGGMGPYVFSWRGPDSLEFVTEDVMGLPAGDYAYELVVTDANQCNFFTTVTLTQPDTALWAVASTTLFNGAGVSCAGSSDGAIDLTVGGGNAGQTISWTGPNGFSADTEDLTSLPGGNYTATITDMNGCIAQLPVELIAPQPLVPILDAFLFPGGSTISCQGANDGAITATIQGGTGPYDLTWTGPNGPSASSTTIEALGEGEYCLHVIDVNGCEAQACTSILAPAAILTSLTTTDAACGASNGTADLVVSGGSAPYAYTWSNGLSTEDLAGLPPGNYTATITDANGCSTFATGVVGDSPALIGSATLGQVSCHDGQNGSIDLSISSGTLPYSFTWSNGSTAEDPTGLPAGTYTVSVLDAAGCMLSESYTIAEPAAVVIHGELSSFAGGHHVSGFGSQDGSIATEVEGGTAPYNYLWSNGATTPAITDLGAGTYMLEVTDANGCTATITFTLTEPTDLVMPNGFSPNGDGANDNFDIHGIEGYSKNLFTVLNRWGNVVYELPNYKNQWHGENSQGEALPDGTYFVILSINDGARTLQGYVDLRR